jgi:hypothetical protein
MAMARCDISARLPMGVATTYKPDSNVIKNIRFSVRNGS